MTPRTDPTTVAKPKPAMINLCDCGQPAYRRGAGGYVCRRCDLMESYSGEFHDVLKGRFRKVRVS